MKPTADLDKNTDLLAQMRETLEQINQTTQDLQQNSMWKIPVYTFAGATFFLLLYTLHII